MAPKADNFEANLIPGRGLAEGVKEYPEGGVRQLKAI